jgi:hypothetical protein
MRQIRDSRLKVFPSKLNWGKVFLASRSESRRMPADYPCKSTVKEKTALRARSRVRALQRFEVRPAAMPLGDGSCSRRTNHPLVASGSCVEPSHKIELVFSASLETVVGASGVRTPSLNRPSAGPGRLHTV